MRQTLTRVLVLVLIGAAVVSCGDDTDGGDDSELSSEEAFCEAGDQLQTAVAGLSEIDPVAGGTDAISAAFDEVREDTNALVASGQDLAADDLNDLERAVDRLGAALGDLGSEVTAENAQEVASAVSDIATAASSIRVTVTETCD